MSDQIESFFVEAAASGIVPGLDRIRSLLNVLGNPQEQLRFIHIAGTNGKGSTGCFCNALLAAENYRVGWFSTPHLVRRSESIRITDGQAGIDLLAQDETAGEISDSAFASVLDVLEEAVKIMLSRGQGRPSEFEIMTAAAILHFVRSECDYVVWETGMGGSGDATNIIKTPEAVIITALGLDHASWLGDDIVSIARHKAGIIKQGSHVWLYDPHSALADKKEADDVLAVFEQTGYERQAQIHLVSSADLNIVEYNLAGQIFCERVETGSVLSADCFKITMLGYYQPLLALLAIKACCQITGTNKRSERQAQALAKAVWPARFELCKPQTAVSGPVILDGAHNPQGCRALADSLAELIPDHRVIYVIGMLADKNVEEMLRHVFLARPYRSGPIICTEPVNKRAMPARELADRVARLTGRRVISLPISPDNSYNNSDLVIYEKNAVRAAKFALALDRGPQVALCVFGSLYLAGAVREYLLDTNNE